MTDSQGQTPTPTSRVMEELSRLPIAQELGRTRLERVAEVGHLEEYDVGRLLFREGDPSDNPRLVISGLVSLLVNVPHQGEIIVGTVSDGELLGWSALLPNHRWRSSARTARTTRCIVFDGAALREMMDVDHELGYQILRLAFRVATGRLGDQFLQTLDVFGHGR
jgi:CRP/FNR family transcriptional regulator, cyclic AMP receptor protein